MSNQHKIIAEDTLRIIEEGFYINSQNEKIELELMLTYSVQHTKLYTPEALENTVSENTNSNNFKTVYEVSGETTLDAARRLSDAGFEDILCLNFASAKNAGGGFLGGAVAQEESIARASGLYTCLLNAPEYYRYHRAGNSCIYSDHMIYSPAVPVFKHEDGSLTEKPLLLTIITSPAVNAGAVKKNEPGKVDLIRPAMKTRIEKLFALCIANKHCNLILGAWGCGVFQNDPEEIAGLFHEALNGRFKNQFKQIVFAVKSNNERFIEPFRKIFL